MSAQTTILLEKGKARELILTGPIKTGVELNSRKLLVQGYTQLQQYVRNALAETIHGLWNFPDVRGNKNGMAIDVEDKRGRTVIPKYFMSLILKDEALIGAMERFGLPMQLNQNAAEEDDEEGAVAPAAVYTITSIEIRMYDFGYGSVMFHGMMAATDDLSLEHYRTIAERMGQQLNDYLPLFKDTYQRITSLIDSKYIMENITQKVQVETTPEALAMRPHKSVGGILWVHRVFVIKTDSEAEFEKLSEECKKLVYSADSEELEDTALTDGLTFYGGNGNSAVIYNSRVAKRADVRLLPRTIQSHNVYFARAEEYDYALFYFNNDLSVMKDSGAHSSNALEKLSRHIIEFQSQITFFHALYDDYDNHLDPQSMAIWFGLAQCWNTSDRFTGIAKKMVALEKVYDRLMQNLGSIQDKKLNTFVLLFTMVSMVSVTVDAVDFTQGQDLQVPAMARIAILGAMALFLILIAGRMVRR